MPSGLTFQQIQKYERGLQPHRGPSRLFEFAKVLDVPVSYFFDEMPSKCWSGRPMSGRGRRRASARPARRSSRRRTRWSSARRSNSSSLYKIREGRVRKRIFEMVKAVGAASHSELMAGRKKR